ncbi:MAG: O-antigen ligase family protein [Planctomycetota bacterium]|nr:O-antigen ligase family protein [Planctomycetota bacterium]
MSGLAFTLFCLTTATMILRPGEMVTALAPIPFYEVLILSTLTLAHQGVLQHFKIDSLKRQPVALCLVGVFIAIPISHLTHAYLGGTIESTIEFTKGAMLFVLLVVVVDRWSRFEKLAQVVATCASFVVFLCVVDYMGVVDFPFIKHAEENYGQRADGHNIRIARMNGTGIFSDPNDISLLIVATAVICFSFLTDRTRSAARFAWAIPIVVLVTGLACTRSRGGMLAACAAIGIMLMFRYGKKVAIGIGCLGLLALPIVAGRQANIDLAEGTGHDRLLLWRDGLAALRSKDLFFGTGHGSYEDIAGLVAHNSYIHAFVELGLFGGTFFFGMFFFSALALFRLNTPDWQILNPKQARFLPYMAAIGAGYAVGLLSLSRCYTVSTLLILALGTAFLNLAGWNLQPRRPVLVWDKPHITKLLAASACMFIACNVFVRIVT